MFHATKNNLFKILTHKIKIINLIIMKSTALRHRFCVIGLFKNINQH